MKRGYLRVSTDEQSHQRQIDGLSSQCDEIHLETISAIHKKRPVYQKLIRKLKRGDTLVVWDLDRAFRSVLDALLEEEKLRKRGIKFKVLSYDYDVDQVDPYGEFVYTVRAAAAQLERKVLIERTKQGMEAARRKGKQIGRPFKLSPGAISFAYSEIVAHRATISGMATQLGCSRNTLSIAFKRFRMQV